MYCVKLYDVTSVDSCDEALVLDLIYIEIIFCLYFLCIYEVNM